MIKAILTPADAKAARSKLGMSQNAVAKATGINRSTLALFEVEKYLLDDSTLQRLYDFYTVLGYEWTSCDDSRGNVPTESDLGSGVRLVDGYAVPQGIDSNEVESIIAQLAANDAAIAELSDQEAKSHWFTDEPDRTGVDKLLLLHASNHSLMRRLQGRTNSNSDGLKSQGKTTHGDLLNAEINCYTTVNSK